MSLKNRKFHFKELFLNFMEDAFDCTLFILFMMFVFCSIPFVIGCVLSYFKIISFELGFGTILGFELLICGIWCFISSLLDKYYY